jgi:hypothetical protein
MRPNLKFKIFPILLKNLFYKVLLYLMDYFLKIVSILNSNVYYKLFFENQFIIILRPVDI